jgi:hypothetical protein
LTGKEKATMTLYCWNIEPTQDSVSQLVANFRQSPELNEDFVRRSNIQLEFDTPRLDLTFDWRGVPGYHPDIVLYPAGGLEGVPITIRLLGYDPAADVYGAGPHTDVHTDDPERTTYPSDEEDVIRRPTIQIRPEETR